MFTDPTVQMIILLIVMNLLFGGGYALNKRLTLPSLTGSVVSDLTRDSEQEDMTAILKRMDSRLARLEEIEIYRFKRELKAQKGKVA